MHFLKPYLPFFLTILTLSGLFDWPALGQESDKDEGAAAEPAAPEPYRPELWKDSEVSSQNNRALFITGKVDFGQAYGTGGSTPGAAAMFHLEPGYIFPRGSWSRIEASLDLSSGLLKFRDRDVGKTRVIMPIGLLALVKFGYGYSLGKGVFGLFRVGAGPATAIYKGTNNVGVDSSSPDPIFGLAGYLGFDVVAPASELIDLVGGISVTHFQFDIDKLTVGGVRQNIGAPLNINLIALGVGLRLKF